MAKLSKSRLRIPKWSGWLCRPTVGAGIDFSGVTFSASPCKFEYVPAILCGRRRKTDFQQMDFKTPYKK